MLPHDDIQSMDAAVRLEGDSPYIDRDHLAKIEEKMAAMDGYHEVVGETVAEFHRAVALLKMKHKFGDDDSILLASAHVREVWEALAPALHRLAEVRPPEPGE